MKVESDKLSRGTARCSCQLPPRVNAESLLTAVWSGLDSVSNFCLPGKRSVLHLAPRHHSTNNEGDMTEIWWKPFLQQGRALEVSGPEVTVKQTGLYLIYSQVLFHDPTFTMGQVLWRASAGGPGQILLRCVQSMPRELEQAYNSCYSGGVFQLQRGDQLSLRVPRANASLDLSPHGTFLGLVRL
nr:tumor necrosis factor ligand superfamily member 13 isoform X3 [Chelonoidis abingdonii]